MPHGLDGTVISKYAEIGANVTIFHNVTIAQEGHYSAVISDDVLIGTGAVLIGNVKIGDKVKIGANAVITHDVPSNSTAVGVPAKIIIKKE